ncbi:AAA family ATPase [bacterium]|nr:AAA family ATPase [bacterium]
MAQYDLNLIDTLRSLEKRWEIIAGSVLVIALAVWFLTEDPAPYYVASSSIKITNYNTITSAVLKDNSFVSRKTDNLQTHAKIMGSTKILIDLAKKMGYIDNDKNIEQITEDPKDIEQVRRMKKIIWNEEETKTNIIKIYAKSFDKKESIKLANTMAEVFRENNINDANRQAIDTRKFIEEQTEIFRVKFDDHEKQMNSFIAENINDISLGESELFDIQNELAEANFKIANLGPQLQQLEIRLIGGSEDYIDWISVDLEDKSLELLNSEVLNLQLKKEQLLIYHKPESPEVRDLESRIKTLIRNMTKEYKTIYENLFNRREELLGKLQVVPTNDANLEKLKRETGLLKDTYVKFRNELQSAYIREAEKIIEVTILEFATDPEEFKDKTRWQKTFLGALAGLIIGFVLAYLFETFDTSIDRIEDVETYIGVPVLGTIPHIDIENTVTKMLNLHPEAEKNPNLTSYASLVTHYEPSSSASESYRKIRTNLDFIKLKKDGNIFMITSTTLDEGKSTTASNLAITLAQMGNRTLLVSCDFRRPNVYKIFGIEKEPGLTNVLLGNYAWEDVIKRITDIFMGDMIMLEEAITNPGLDNLNIITAGSIPTNPSELLASNEMSLFLERIKTEFDVVLIDAPPVLPVTDAAILASKVDGIIMVYQVSKAARTSLKRAVSHLQSVNGDIWGVILNDVKSEIGLFSEDKDYYSRYYTEMTPEDDTVLGLFKFKAKEFGSNLKAKYSGDNIFSRTSDKVFGLLDKVFSPLPSKKKKEDYED